jgi:hypothetical protein
MIGIWAGRISFIFFGSRSEVFPEVGSLTLGIAVAYRSMSSTLEHTLSADSKNLSLNTIRASRWSSEALERVS